MSGYLRPAATLLLLLTLLTGGVYPALVTVFAQVLFSDQANGSLIKDKQGLVIGSTLIGQAYTELRYFWSRPSATSPYAYNGAASSGSNIGPTNPALLQAVSTRIQTLKNADPENLAAVPIDLVTASASGLDPHISIAAAEYQVNRVAKANKVSVTKLRELIVANTEGRLWGLFGEPRVHVVKLNLAVQQAVTN